MRVLITGTSGFIGRNVIKQLKQTIGKDEIITFSSSESDGIRNINSNNYNIDDDYLIEEKCEDVDTLIHIGAFIPKTIKDANLIDDNTSNIINTKKLLVAFSRLPKIKKIVFISSVDVYAETDDILTESSVIGPQTLYGWSKLYCEELIKNFAFQNNLDYCILRLGHVYGEGEEKYKKVMPIMIKSAIQNEDIKIYGDGEALRTFIYIDDVGKAIINAAFSESIGTINVVGNKASSINDLAKEIVAYSGNSVNICHIPTSCKNRNLIFDNSKLMDNLLDSLTPFEDGLKKEVEYMRNIK